MSVKIIKAGSNYVLKVNSSYFYGGLIAGRVAFLSSESDLDESSKFDSVRPIRLRWSADRQEIIQASKYNVYTKDPASGSLIKTHSPEFLYEVLEDVFVTALEGGSNYWLDFSSGSIKSIKILTDGGMRGSSFAERALASILFYGNRVNVIDSEEGYSLCRLTLDLVRKRYAKLEEIAVNRNIVLKKGKGGGYEDTIRSAMHNVLQENYDANDTDIVMQYLCLEDIVYG